MRAGALLRNRTAPRAGRLAGGGGISGVFWGILGYFGVFWGILGEGKEKAAPGSAGTARAGMGVSEGKLYQFLPQRV